MKVIDRNISELIGAEYNPRFINEEAFEHLKDSIKRFDAVEPVLVNMNPNRLNIIISGHQRIKAAKALDMKTFPCVELNLSIAKEKELNIRMNKNTGAWDWDALANNFEVEELTEWGFTEDELFGNEELELPDELTDEHKEKEAVIKITFGTIDYLNDAMSDIEKIVEKYNDSYISVSAGEL